jgi:hypothetical protein
MDQDALKLIPFHRLVCECTHCSLLCQYMPGKLIPQDLLRMVPQGANVYEWAEEHLRVSNDLMRPNLLPRSSDNGACHWFRDGKCLVHETSPFGCAYFSWAQEAADVYERMRWGEKQIEHDLWVGGLYSQVCRHLRGLGLWQTEATEPIPSGLKALTHFGTGDAKGLGPLGVLAKNFTFKSWQSRWGNYGTWKAHVSKEQVARWSGRWLSFCIQVYIVTPSWKREDAHDVMMQVGRLYANHGISLEWSEHTLPSAENIVETVIYEPGPPSDCFATTNPTQRSWWWSNFPRVPSLFFVNKFCDQHGLPGTHSSMAVPETGYIYAFVSGVGSAAPGVAAGHAVGHLLGVHYHTDFGLMSAVSAAYSGRQEDGFLGLGENNPWYIGPIEQAKMRDYGE